MVVVVVVMILVIMVGRKDLISVVLPTKELQQQDLHSSDTDQFESLPASAVTSQASSQSLVAVSSAAQ